jgi:RHS repeat-associated protein
MLALLQKERLFMRRHNCVPQVVQLIGMLGAALLVPILSFAASQSVTCDPTGGTQTIGIEYTVTSCVDPEMTDSTVLTYTANTIACIGNQVIVTAPAAGATQSPTALVAAISASVNSLGAHWKVFRNDEGSHFVQIDPQYVGSINGITIPQFADGSFNIGTFNRAFVVDAAPLCRAKNVSADTLSLAQPMFVINPSAPKNSLAFSLTYQSLIDQMPSAIGGGWGHPFEESIAATENPRTIRFWSGGVSRYYRAPISAPSTFYPEDMDRTTITKNGDGSYTHRDKTGFIRNFSATGVLVAMSDHNSNTITLTYTGLDLTGITVRGGQTLTLGYTGGKLTTVMDPLGNVSTLAYSGGKLQSVTNPDATSWSYTYDSSGFLNTRKLSKGADSDTATYTYDTDNGKGRLRSVAISGTGMVAPATRSVGVIQSESVRYLPGKIPDFYLPVTPWTQPSGTGAFPVPYETVTSNDITGKVSSVTTDSWRRLPMKVVSPTGGTVYFIRDLTGNIVRQIIDDGKGNGATGGASTTLGTMVSDLPGAVICDTSLVLSSRSTIAATAQYDAAGNVISVIDATGGVTNYTYTASNTLKERRYYATAAAATIAIGTETERWIILYDTNENPSAIGTWDRLSGSDDFMMVSDSWGQVTSLSRPSGSISGPSTVPTVGSTEGVVVGGNSLPTPLFSFVYSASGLVATAIQHTVTPSLFRQMAYDDNGRRVRMSTPQTSLETAYDSRGRVVSVTDQQNNTTQFAYDFRGNTVSNTDANGKVSLSAYDSLGRVLWQKDANGAMTSITRAFTANTTLPDITTVTDANNQSTQFRFTASTRVSSVVDSLGKAASSVQDPILQAQALGTTVAGSTATAIDRNTVSVVSTTNASGQLTSTVYPDATSETFTYDAAGRMLTAVNKDISYTYLYSPYGGLESITDNRGFTRAFTYAGVSTLKVTAGKDGDTYSTTTITDIINQQVISISSNAGLFQYTYDNLGRRSGLTYPNAVTATPVYDSASNVLSITHSLNSAPIAAFGYTYDKTGNAVTKTTTTGTETYTYDNIYQLIAAGTPNGNEAYTYDAVGNRLTGPGMKDIGYTYMAENQQIVGRLFGQTFDAAGNLINRTVTGAAAKGWTYSWDYANRLVKAEKVRGSDKQTVTFKYDPFGRRIEKKTALTISGVTSTTTYAYFYDSNNNIIYEILTLPNGTTEKTWYTHGTGVDEPLAMERNGQRYFFHADKLGSIAAITDTTGAAVQSYRYDSFGNATASTSFRNSYAFTSREYDGETGLYYYRARYYDSMDGRFISRDPIGLAGGINQYAYVKNSPVNATDPSGLLESHWLLRTLVPGQVAWDNALTAFENGDYLGAGINATAMPLEQVMFVLSFGQASIAKKGLHCSINTTRVTSWASEGVTPDLNPGRWVQLGDATKTNFWRTGLPGPKAILQNEFPFLKIEGSKVPFANSITESVPTSSLKWPQSWEWWKGILNQRQIKP